MRPRSPSSRIRPRKALRAAPLRQLADKLGWLHHRPRKRITNVSGPCRCIRKDALAIAFHLNLIKEATKSCICVVRALARVDCHLERPWRFHRLFGSEVTFKDGNPDRLDLRIVVEYCPINRVCIAWQQKRPCRIGICVCRCCALGVYSGRLLWELRDRTAPGYIGASGVRPKVGCASCACLFVVFHDPSSPCLLGPEQLIPSPYR